MYPIKSSGERDKKREREIERERQRERDTERERERERERECKGFICSLINMNQKYNQRSILDLKAFVI